MPEKGKGYTNLTVRIETAKRLLEFAREKNLRTMDYFEQLVQNLEVLRLQNAAVSIAFEDKLTKIWYRLYYLEKSLTGLYELRDSLLRDGQDVPLFDGLMDVIDVRTKTERMLNEAYPRWYQRVSHSEPFILVMRSEELKTVAKDIAQRLDECFSLVQEVKNILPNAPLARALEDIMSPLVKARKALNVLI